MTKAVSAQNTSNAADSKAAVLTKAVLRTADILNLKNAELGDIIGVSAPTVTRLRQGKAFLAPGDKSYELGVMLVRLYRSLSPIVGGDDASAQSWLRGENTALRAAPIDLIKTIPGFAETVRYVDARRAPI